MAVRVVSILLCQLRNIEHPCWAVAIAAAIREVLRRILHDTVPTVGELHRLGNDRALRTHARSVGAGREGLLVGVRRGARDPTAIDSSDVRRLQSGSSRRLVAGDHLQPDRDGNQVLRMDRPGAIVQARRVRDHRRSIGFEQRGSPVQAVVRTDPAVGRLCFQGSNSRRSGAGLPDKHVLVHEHAFVGDAWQHDRVAVRSIRRSADDDEVDFGFENVIVGRTIRFGSTNGWEVVALRCGLRHDAPAGVGVRPGSGNPKRAAHQRQHNHENERETTAANTHRLSPPTETRPSRASTYFSNTYRSETTTTSPYRYKSNEQSSH